MWYSAAQSFPAVRAFADCGEHRQNQSRTCRRTCSRLIVEGRVAALFRCTLDPMVLQSRNLETSIIHRWPPHKQHYAHLLQTRDFTNSHAVRRFSHYAVSVFYVSWKHFGVRTQYTKDQMSSRLIISPAFDLHLASSSTLCSHLTKPFAHLQRVSLDLGRFEAACGRRMFRASCMFTAVPPPPAMQDVGSELI